MVRAELIYNPYLLETKVFFNGNPPRINSLVEKYQNEKLQTWVNDIPAIFYDEMNGFNFELDFSGTKLDFEELKKSFILAGVGKDKVQLFHKSSLGSRNEKMQAVQDLLSWLKNTPNRKFDQEEFFENNKDLFNGAYPYVVIGGSLNNDHLFDDICISVDNIESADELKKTDLHSTPILFYLDRKSVQFLQFNLRITNSSNPVYLVNFIESNYTNLSLDYQKGMTTADIESHMKELYDIDISDSTISRITDS